MVCNIGQERLVRLPVQAIEEALKGPRHLHVLVVAERSVQLGQDQVEASVLLGQDGFHLWLQLSPCHSVERGQDIQHCLLRFVLQLQLASVEIDPLSPLPAILRSVREDRDVCVLLHLHASRARNSRWAISCRRHTGRPGR